MQQQLQTSSDTSDQLVSRFVTQFPHHRKAITTAIHAWAVEQHRAVFFIPLASLKRDDRDYVEVHVYDTSNGKLVDIGTTFAWGDLETALLNMVANYTADACRSCIQARTLCVEHRPPNGQKYAEMTCESCGHYDEHSEEGSQETFTWLRPCDGNTGECPLDACGGVYECGDCGHEMHV